MTYTYTQVANMALLAQCCLGDKAYKQVVAEAFNRPGLPEMDLENEYLLGILGILESYRPIGYVFDVNDYTMKLGDQCIDNVNLQAVVEELNLLCGCCSNRQVLSMQPSLPLPTTLLCDLTDMNFAVCFDSGTSTFKAFVASNVNTIPYTQYYYEYAVSEDDVVWDDIPNEHSWLLSTAIDTGAYVSVRVRVYCKQGDSTYTELVRTIKDPNSALTFNNFGFINIDRIGTNDPITSDLYIFDDDTVTIKNLNTNFTIASITNVNTSVVLAANTNSYTNLASNMVSDGDQILVKFKLNNAPAFTCLTESLFTVHLVPKLDPDVSFILCPGGTKTISIPDEYDSYLWFNDDTTYFTEVDTIGTFTVSATTGPLTQTIDVVVTLETDAPNPVVVDDSTGDVLTSPVVLLSPDTITMRVVDTGMYSSGYPTGTTVEWVTYWFPADASTTVDSSLGHEFYAQVTVPGVDCAVNSNTIIVDTRALTFIPTAISPKCHDGSDGMIEITPVTNGDLIFEIYNGATLIDTVTSTGNAVLSTNLPIGTYDIVGVQIFPDGVNPSVTISTTITNPSAITAIGYSATNLTCHDSNDGTIGTFSTTGGVSPYVYFLNGVAAGTGVLGLTPGDYIISVIDNGGEGCEFIGDTITILNPDPITVFPTIGNTTGGLNNGTASFTIGGGTGTYPTIDLYDVSFNLIGSGLSFTGLAAGDYIYIIVDSNGCDSQYNFTIT